MPLPLWELRGVGARAAIGRATSIAAWALFLIGAAMTVVRLAGFDFVYLRGGSMEPTYAPGALLIARPARSADIEVGDVVVFPSGTQHEPKIVHRVVALQSDGSRRIALTKGDNNPVLDPEPLLLVGSTPRVALGLPYLGWWATPTLGWYLLGVGSVLACLALWRLRIPGGTNGLRSLGPTSGVAYGWVGVFLEMREGGGVSVAQGGPVS